MIIVFAQIGLFTAKSMGTKKNRFPYGLAIFFLLSQSKKKQPNRKQKQEKQEQNGRKKEVYEGILSFRKPSSFKSNGRSI